MFSFSTKNGTPIALGIDIISRKKKPNTILHLNEKEDDSQSMEREMLQATDFDYINDKDFDEILEALNQDKLPESEKLQKKLKLARKIIKNRKKKEFFKPNLIFSQIPNPESRECCFVCGPSGSGKSTYVSNYAENYQKVFPDNPIYLISRLEQDDVLDCIYNLKRIVLSPDMTDYEVKTNELENSLVIFDDIDTLPNKKVKDFVYKLIDDLLQTGRHSNTYVVVTAHLLYNSHKTRIVLNECHTITLFPNRSTRHSINYLLIKYFGLTKKEITDLCKLNSRWITIYKNPPMVLYEKGAKLLN